MANDFKIENAEIHIYESKKGPTEEEETVQENDTKEKDSSNNHIHKVFSLVSLAALKEIMSKII